MISTFDILPSGDFLECARQPRCPPQAFLVLLPRSEPRPPPPFVAPRPRSPVIVLPTIDVQDRGRNPHRGRAEHERANNRAIIRPQIYSPECFFLVLINIGHHR